MWVMVSKDAHATVTLKARATVFVRLPRLRRNARRPTSLPRNGGCEVLARVPTTLRLPIETLREVGRFVADSFWSVESRPVCHQA